MKKHILIATGLAVLSTSAFASKARMEALGQNAERGSKYFGDDRNVFHNPAHLNNMKNYVVTEWGTAAANDTTAAPSAEGGFYREMGSFAYGVHLGSLVGAHNTERTAADANFLSRDNGLDLMFAGDAGVQWGARVHYSNSKDETGQTHERKNGALGLGLGIIMGDLEVYANLDIKDESEGTVATSNAKWEADMGIHAGASYGWNGWTFYGSYDKSGAEYNDGTNAAYNPDDRTALKLGFGRIHEVSNTARVYTDLTYSSSKTETKTSSTSATLETKTNELPLNVGFEVDATSWLVLRGSISQPIVINNTEVSGNATAINNGKQVQSNQTDVAAGATLNFGKLKVDGVVGTSGNAGTANSGETGTLSLDRLMTRVAVHYWF